MPKLPRVTARRVISALERAGFAVRRQTGSHVILRHPDTRKMAVVPQHGGVLGPGVVASILRQAGLTSEDLRGLMR